jgi:hypothetical protein
VRVDVAIVVAALSAGLIVIGVNVQQGNDAAETCAARGGVLVETVVSDDACVKRQAVLP